MTQFFKKTYLSLYLKGLCVRGSWRPNRTATYWPPTLMAISVSFPFSWADQPGAWCPASLGAGSGLQTPWISCALSYIIVQHPLNLLCTSAVFGIACLIVIERKKTVMQFTGHSLPVHQFVAVPWDFNRPILSAKLTHANRKCTTAVFGMACMPGSEVNILHICFIYFLLSASFLLTGELERTIFMQGTLYYRGTEYALSCHERCK